jgi:hypothetical protein
VIDVNDLSHRFYRIHHPLHNAKSYARKRSPFRLQPDFFAYFWLKMGEALWDNLGFARAKNAFPLEVFRLAGARELK